MRIVAALMDGRTPRERALIAGAVALLLAWAAVSLFWQPLWTTRAALEVDILRADQMLARVKGLPPPSSVVEATDDRPLSVIATASAGDLGLEVRRLQPQGEAVQVVLGDAPFDIVVVWIAALERDHALRLTDLTLSRRPAPGIVTATLTLERKG